MKRPEHSAIEEYAEIKLAEYYFSWYLVGCLAVSLMLVFTWFQIEKLWSLIKKRFG
jgi:hypothetical protein